MLAKQILKRFSLQNSIKKILSNNRLSSSLVQENEYLNNEKNIVKCHLPDVYIPNVTIQEYVWQKLDSWPDHTAVVCSATGRKYTYAQCRKMSYNLARALRARLKLQRGQVIAIVLPNIPEYPIAILGALEAGLIITTVNPIYTAEEIGKQLVDSGARAVISLVSFHNTIQNATKGNLPVITIKHNADDVTPQGAINFTEFCEREVSNAPDMGYGDYEDVAIMPYSSGTTGLPKGVELTHRNIIANLSQTEMFDGNIIATTTKTTQDSISCVLPMYHIYGLTVNTLKMMCLGGKLVTMPRFTPETYVQMLSDYKPNHLYLVPPIVIFLAAHPSVTPKHLEMTKHICSGAAPLGATDVERLFEKIGREVVALQGYGMTETSPGITFTFPDIWKECFGSIGKCLPNTELKVVSVEDGVTPLGPNEQGELLVKGPQVMKQYHNNPKATEEVFQDGFLKTGDMVYYDDKKIFWVTDRLKELIKVKGFQVAPAELEAIIRNHPSIADAAVIGIPHPISGEVPRAYIVPKSGKTINQDEIKDYVAKQVASYKKLEGGISIIDAIPKNPSGKIMRRELKKLFEEKEI